MNLEELINDSKVARYRASEEPEDGGHTRIWFENSPLPVLLSREEFGAMTGENLPDFLKARILVAVNKDIVAEFYNSMYRDARKRYARENNIPLCDVCQDGESSCHNHMTGECSVFR